MAASKNTIAALGLSAFLSMTATIGAPVSMLAEGTALTPYFDKIGKKVTWCTGETEVGYKEKFTYAECGALFKMRYGYYSMRVAYMYSDMAKQTVTPEMHAAATDLAYNVGLDAFKNSSMLAAFNAGAARQGCDAILLYKKAGGKDCSLPANKKVCGGIWDRRLTFHDLCVGGIQ